jgi:hypothetical protein
MKAKVRNYIIKRTPIFYTKQLYLNKNKGLKQTTIFELIYSKRSFVKAEFRKIDLSRNKTIIAQYIDLKRNKLIYCAITGFIAQ